MEKIIYSKNNTTKKEFITAARVKASMPLILQKNIVIEIIISKTQYGPDFTAVFINTTNLFNIKTDIMMK